MLQPVNLQLAHFNVEHSAQISRDAIAAAQQTGQGQEVVKESVKRTQMVQANIAATEPRKVQRREEDERERRQEEQQQSFSSNSDSYEEAQAQPDVIPEKIAMPAKGFDLYA